MQDNQLSTHTHTHTLTYTHTVSLAGLDIVCVWFMIPFSQRVVLTNCANYCVKFALEVKNHFDMASQEAVLFLFALLIFYIPPAFPLFRFPKKCLADCAFVCRITDANTYVSRRAIRLVWPPIKFKWLPQSAASASNHSCGQDNSTEGV